MGEKDTAILTAPPATAWAKICQQMDSVGLCRKAFEATTAERKRTKDLLDEAQGRLDELLQAARNGQGDLFEDES